MKKTLVGYGSFWNLFSDEVILWYFNTTKSITAQKTISRKKTDLEKDIPLQSIKEESDKAQEYLQKGDLQIGNFSDESSKNW